ncbi:LOB domain-containing protein 1-like [Henckelia pumila]|uniref:LOB domain-containing protein 1-like n=1 Tax=Henckelia pumila TaxID=405737 RepID=UPI003C6DFB60
MAAEGSPSAVSPPPAVVNLSPCAACKILRRRCRDNKCILAPYFPPTEPLKFAIAHRVFGASNIIKMLKGLPDDCREDAVNSMVYEANARLRDPVYGCTGAIYQLQHQITELQAELAKAQVQNIFMQTQTSSLLFKDHNGNDQEMLPQSMPLFYEDSTLAENNIASGVNAWDFNPFGNE